jgi:hypothetical protein
VNSLTVLLSMTVEIILGRPVLSSTVINCLSFMNEAMSVNILVIGLEAAMTCGCPVLYTKSVVFRCGGVYSKFIE